MSASFPPPQHSAELTVASTATATDASPVLTGGFADPSRDSARAFRAIMDAMARPGRIHRVGGARPPAPLSVAAGIVLLTLADPDTPLYLAGAADCAPVRDWLRFHCGAPLAEADQAVLALGRWDDLAPLSRFQAGSAEYPDQSATLIVEAERLEAAGARLTGPGIRDVARLNLPDPAFHARNHARFPLGIDLFLTCGDRLAALPRSTRVTDEAAEGV